ASFGYTLGWVVLLCVPVLHSIFAVSARIGHQTGKGLIDLIREQYGRRPAVVIALLILVINLAMIIGDLVAVSESFSLITGLSRSFFLAGLGFSVWYLLILGNYQKTTNALGMMALILIAYVVAAYQVSGSLFSAAANILVPKIQMSREYMMGVVAIFGSLLTPDV